MSWSDPAIADRGAFTYDAAGRMTEADNDYSEVTRTYDPAGRLKTDTQNIAGFGSRKVQYKYSQDALLLRMWVADGNGYDRTYAYDDRARLAAEERGQSAVASFLRTVIQGSILLV